MRTLAALLTVCILVPAGARAEDDRVEAHVETFPLILRTEERPDALMTTVVDARTGVPIAGATVRGYAETIDGRAAAVNALLLTMKTDRYGLAVGQIDTRALSASHWIVSAEGYRPYAEYHGFWPPERVDLEPATPVAVRILGPYGEPVTGALVEGYTGCPHAPPAVRGRTDENGVFRAADGSPEGFSLWVRAPGCASTSEELPAVFGDEPCVEVLPPGISVRGRVRDGDGRPIPGVVLRGANYPRGPAAVTDIEGRFVLEGLDPEEGLQVFHPTIHLDAPHVVERVAEDVPLDLVWTLEGLAPVGEPGTVTIHARGPDGEAVADLDLLVVGPDGRADDGTTDAEGKCVLALSAGRYRVRGDDPFDPFDVKEEVVVVPPDGEVSQELALSPRPRLQIAGQVPTDLGLSIVAAGRAYSGPGESEEPNPPVWVPAQARAVICLRNYEQAWAHFVPVGPVVDGVRTATLDVPSPHSIRLAGDVALDGASVVLTPRAHPGVERWLMDIVDGTVPVWWGGRFDLTLQLEDGRPDRVVPLDLPPLASGAVERRIEIERDATPVSESGEARLILKRADGQPVREVTVSGGKVGAAWSGFRGEWDNPVEVSAPCRVLVTAPGLHPLQLDVTSPGERDVVFPAAGIDLTTVDASGSPVASAVLVNGVLYEAPEGRLSMRGFPAGDHAVVLQRTTGTPVVTQSVRWSFRVSDGQVLKKAARLP